MSLFDFDNSYARLPGDMFAEVAPTPVPAPELVALNIDLAENLGLAEDRFFSDELRDVLAGNKIASGSQPIAQAYAGHQFGNFVPQLGDGRAHLLGEVIDRSGQRQDIVLKGSGPTPFSRNGDGRAWMGPVLREYVISEAMHAMGVPTTRALAIVATGDRVQRERAFPGAVLTRVATSHIRVGTFQYFSVRNDLGALRALVDMAIARHYPDAGTDMPADAEAPLALLTAAVAAQASLIAEWMGLGFIHGVMNTDNAHVGGITIDYGPCAFMEAFDNAKVFSSIDHAGRYAYQNQPNIAAWNMAQLATSLLPLFDDQTSAIDKMTEIVNGFIPAFRAAWRHEFARKIGVTDPIESDDGLITDLLGVFATEGIDFTSGFRDLTVSETSPIWANSPGFAAWKSGWMARRAPDVTTIMAQANPWVIPRNHLIENSIAAAIDGDFAPFETLHNATIAPYEKPDDIALITPATPMQSVERTFCGT